VDVKQAQRAANVAQIRYDDETRAMQKLQDDKHDPQQAYRYMEIVALIACQREKVSAARNALNQALWALEEAKRQEEAQS